MLIYILQKIEVLPATNVAAKDMLLLKTQLVATKGITDDMLLLLRHRSYFIANVVSSERDCGGISPTKGELSLHTHVLCVLFLSIFSSRSWNYSS